jgi:hypothetical protein
MSPNPNSGLTSIVNSLPFSLPMSDFSTIGSKLVSLP